MLPDSLCPDAQFFPDFTECKLVLCVTEKYQPLFFRQ